MPVHALSWLDTRSAQETEEMVRLIGKEKLFYLTGKMPYPYGFPQLVWIRRNDPVMYQKIWKYMLPLDFLNFRLTGVPMMDYSIAKRYNGV